jgi:hypothetical protein
MKTRGVRSQLLVGVAILIVFGHVCALPVHAHVGVVTPHTEDHPERGGDEAIHDGSCEALRTDSNVNAPALQTTGIVLSVIGSVEVHRAHATLAPAAASSPPLFLLHSALLI